MKTSERHHGYDILRVIAIILVPVLHCFAYIPELNDDLLSLKWIAFTALHYLSLICVPLFMMLSGGLMRKKTLSGRYYAGLIKIILPYVLISIAAILAVWYKSGVAPTFFGAVRSILNFNAIAYSWYVEMYIGLYLIIPFLNIIFSALDKKGNTVLLLTLISLTALPKFLVGIYSGLDFIPDWWSGFYPITYYFLGAYLAEYRPKVKKPIAAIGLLFSIFLPTAVNYFHTMRDGSYAWYVMNASDCLSTLLIALFVWLLFADIERVVRPVSAVVTEISVCSFEMYLFSYLADGFLYGFTDVLTYYTSMIHIPPFFVMSFAVILLSYICARVTRLFTVPVLKLINRKIAAQSG